MMFSFDNGRTQSRIETLKQYYENNVLCGQRFICTSHQSCRNSVPNVEYFEGQLSHVGGRYDLSRDCRELRLIISGISYGHTPNKVSMENRGKMVVDRVGIDKSFYRTKVKKGRNPHMKGTTLLLKRILLGKAALKNYASWREEFVDGTNCRENHIFSMFALVNILLCSALIDNTRDKSSHLMKIHCFSHYLETLKILQPNLVVFQTQGTFEMLLKETGLAKFWNRQDANLGYFSGPGLSFTACEFYHPSHPRSLWGCKPVEYFNSVIMPTLDVALRQIGFE